MFYNPVNGYKSLNAGPVHIVGHSRGGSVVLRMISENPHLYQTAVLADPAPFHGMLSMKLEETDEIRKRNNNIKKALDQITIGDLNNGLEIFTDT
ncbi:MAG: alpha/beta hydrolase, partial [Desulfobacterales bacterium]|nr:alpha/beta hydrolase [Desulfobacterales bacterium]